MQMKKIENADTLTCIVQWYSKQKHYGFVAPKGGGRDILLHENVLRSFGLSGIAAGSIFEVTTAETERGVQVKEILSQIPAPSQNRLFLDTFTRISNGDLDAAPLLPARVKWFDRVRGFGFAQAFGGTEDIFIHIDVLRQSGLDTLDAGEAVGLRQEVSARGALALEIRPWCQVTTAMHA